MKKIFFVLFFATTLTYAQKNNNSSEDIFGIKIGLIGGWLNYEKSLSEKITLNTEIGYEGGFLKGTDNKIDYIFTTTFSIEPRYYYNFEKRKEKGKKTNNNSANYFSTEIFYVSDLLSSSNRNNLKIIKSFSLIPKYGLRRVLSEKLNFEFAFGLGYSWGENSINGIASSLDLRINLKL